MKIRLPEVIPPYGYTVTTTVVPNQAPDPQTRRLHWTIGPVTTRTSPGRRLPPRPYFQTSGDVSMQLQDDQQVTLTVSGTDAAGNPVPMDARTSLSFASSDETVLTVTDNGDGTALVVTTGTLGTATVTVSDDPDGDGTANFQGSLAIDVVTGAVVEIALEAGEPSSRL